MKLHEFYTEEEADKFLFEMANFGGAVTGIENVIVWASQAQDGAKRHGPRIKVSSHYTSKAKADDFFVLSIQDDPQVVAGESFLKTDDLQDIKDWVVLNKEALMKFWNGELLTDEFLKLLAKVR